MVTEGTASTLLRWIPLLPLLAAVAHGVSLGLLRREIPRGLTIALSCGSVGFAFLLACIALGDLLALPEGSRLLVDELYTWIGTGVAPAVFSAEVSFVFDPLSAVMVLVVSGVGSLIHVYSVGYMDEDHRDDKGFQRFFCYLNLFTFSLHLAHDVLHGDVPILPTVDVGNVEQRPRATAKDERYGIGEFMAVRHGDEPDR